MSHSTTHRLSALLLIWALLLCHGVFGALHLIPTPIPHPAGGPAATHHPSHAAGVAPKAPHEHPATHHAEYFAVLLGTLLISLCLWRPLPNGRRRDETPSARRLAGSSPATFANLPRGPTLPFLQVLRL